MFRTRLQSVALCTLTSLILMVSLPVLAQKHKVRYTITDLGVLPGKTSTTAFGTHSINNAGQVIGHCNNGDLSGGLYGDYFTGNIPFVWTQETGMHALPIVPGLPNASGYSLNNRGEFIGIAGSSYFDARLALWSKRSVQTLEPLPGDNSTYPQAINDKGEVVGISQLFGGPAIDSLIHQYPVVWRNGKIHRLPTDGLGGQANSINEKGQIAGFLDTLDPGDMFHSVAVLWDKRGRTILGTLGGDYGAAWHLNDRGQVVGQSTTAGGELHTFLWENGIMTDCGSRGGSFASLWDINNKGVAVGEATDINEVDHAVIVKNGVMRDLNDFIPANSGWILAGAGGINEKGQITGGGIHNGQVRVFLLTPIHSQAGHDDDGDD